MISLIRPEVYMPIYGFPHMLHGNARNAKSLGYTDEKIIIGKNGQIIEFTKDSFVITNQFIPHRLTTVDGNLVGFTREPTLHDRYQLSLGGSVIVSMVKKGHEFLIELDSIGFPSFKELPKLDAKIREVIHTILAHDLDRFSDVSQFKKFVAKKVGDCIFYELAKEPVVTVITH